MTHNLINAGFPQSSIDVGFPLQGMPRAAGMNTWDIQEIGIGSEFEKGLLGDAFDMSNMMEEIMAPGLEDMLNSEGFAQINANMEALKASTVTGVEPISTGTAIAAAGVVVAFLGVLIAAFNTGYEIGKDYAKRKRQLKSQDTDGDGVNDWDDNFPEDKDKSFKADEDMDGDGVPDWLQDEMRPAYMFHHDSLRDAGFILSNFTEGAARVSVSATGDAFIMDVAITGPEGTSAQQMVLKA